MLTYRGTVSHRWRRAMVLRDLDEGRVRREAVCDADFLLMAAARHHGWDSERPCPVCGSVQLRGVRWIYGDTLGRRSGTARREDEIEAIVRELAEQKVPEGKDGEVAVHLVEVCLVCHWNHLLSTAVAVVD